MIPNPSGRKGGAPEASDETGEPAEYCCVVDAANLGFQPGLWVDFGKVHKLFVLSPSTCQSMGPVRCLGMD